MENAAGWEASAEAWIKNVATDATRIHVLDAPMLAECGDVRDQAVIDIGCGEGRFSRLLAARGANVTGIDPTEAFINLARKQHAAGDYRVGLAEALPFENETFDLAVSYLVILDIEDYQNAISEMVRVLRPGGKVVMANLQSFATTRASPWFDDDAGNHLHLAVDNYLETRGDTIEWNGISIVNYHRPLSAYMNALIDHGLKLKRFLEPVPDAESIREVPRLADYLRIPFMWVMTWEKPE